MRKIKKINLKALKKDLRELSEQEMWRIIGGSGTPPASWDCMFNTFIYYHQLQTGLSLNKSNLVEAYNSFSGRNAQADGGVVIGTFLDMISEQFFTTGTTSDTPSSFNNSFVVVKDDPTSSITHIVFLQGALVDPSTGKVIGIRVHDATRNRVWDYELEQVQGYINYDNLPVYMDTPIGSSSGGGWGSGSFYYA